jgi:hypothetical protein
MASVFDSVTLILMKFAFFRKLSHHAFRLAEEAGSAAGKRRHGSRKGDVLPLPDRVLQGQILPAAPVLSQRTCSRIRCQAASGSWTRSRKWETQRTLFSSAWATVCPPAKVSGVCLCLANIASAQKSLTFAQLMARLQAMRHAFWTVAALRSALSARGNVLLEILALHHQLGVLARSDRRFRPSDRLLWVCF